MISTAAHSLEAQIPVGEIVLQGILQIPHAAQGLAVFAHGSGSSRHSARNQHVAQLLQQDGLATLLFDLLTVEEEEIDLRTRHLRFNIELLANRMTGATDWLVQQPETHSLPVGYFGASTGAAAALISAAARPDVVRAVVSRGGRPDLAGDILSFVSAPTLLIVGGKDTPVITMNQAALARLGTAKKLTIIPGATHLFEEPGALEEVARLASDWFMRRSGHKALRSIAIAGQTENTRPTHSLASPSAVERPRSPMHR
ncbi:MAG: dienelactone hydrolase family protein [Caldilineaceae bacterium]|nr:dienelactone hydrolase family protein [Caldilineaceae bacterium]